MKLPRLLNPSAWNWDALFARLQNLPSVNVNLVFLLIADAATLVWAWGLSYQTDGHGDLSVLIAWLTYLAGRHGFGAWAYKVKRDTSHDGNRDEDDAAIIPPRGQRASTELHQ